MFDRPCMPAEVDSGIRHANESGLRDIDSSDIGIPVFEESLRLAKPLEDKGPRPLVTPIKNQGELEGVCVCHILAAPCGAVIAMPNVRPALARTSTLGDPTRILSVPGPPCDKVSYKYTPWHQQLEYLPGAKHFA